MKISIITINYNNAVGLEKTIKSVLSQTYLDFEYIVIDGGSSDGSKDIINKNSVSLDYFVSEPDYGIYNAMNKGILASKGQYLLFLNSGDTFVSENILSTIASEIVNEDFIYGNLVIVEKHKSWIKTYPSVLKFSYFIKDTLPHPATLIKKLLFEEIGLYNESNSIVSDWEFFLLAINRYNCSYKHIPLNISNFMYDGISSLDGNLHVRRSERKRALQLHFPTFLSDYEELDRINKELELIQLSRFFKFYKRIKKIIHNN